jgi:hypothetical protein
MIAIALITRWVCIAGIASALYHGSASALVVAVVGFGLASRAARIERDSTP